MHRYLLRIFSSKIVVVINLNYFYFMRKGQKLKFRTIIYISENGKVLGVGDSMLTEEFRKIELFRNQNFDLSPYDKGDCLEVFFRYCFRKIIEQTGRYIFKPLMIFKNSNHLRGILCGYEKTILRYAAERAGGECVFQD
jgi:hypothetical protein